MEHVSRWDHCVEPTSVERGERLFFFSKLAHDNWMNCHSCHSHGHTNGQLNDNLTDESFGTPKKIMSLLGQAQTMPYSWSGKFKTIEEQVQHSIRSTMATEVRISPQVIKDIAEYVRALPAPPSLTEARQSLPMPAEKVDLAEGRKLFEQLNCTECHSGALYTSNQRVDVDLTDEVGMHEFNPPSLIAVSQRQNALFHDGRARSLREVLEKYQHQMPRELTELERNRLEQFLRSL
ncbi:MAG: cytochrome c peroxidase [Pirellulaceae bacterium]